MELFGTTRSRCRRSHALIAPDSFVTSDLPGWERSQGVILIAPRIGARFSQYLAMMEPEGAAGQPPPGVERVLYVLEGQVSADGAGLDRASARSRRVRLLRSRRRCRGARDGRRHASTSSRSGTPSGLAIPVPDSFWGDAAGVCRASRSWAIPTRSSRSSCRATRGLTSPSTCLRFGPERRCRWSRFT